MVKNGQVMTIRQITYEPVDTSGNTVETMSFERLRDLNDGGTQRADFHVMAVGEQGHGSLSVDFEHVALSPRTALCIAPGAVHRWEDGGDSLLVCRRSPLDQASAVHT